jgi:polysaccharide export outer membrane protein
VQCLMRPAEIPARQTPVAAGAVVGGTNRVASEAPSADKPVVDRTKACFDSTEPATPMAAQPEILPSYPTVVVNGSVRTAGIYPFEKDMRVSDLLRAGGGLSERAYTLKAELIRYRVDAEQIRRRDILTIDLQKLLAGDTTADAVVEPYDELAVRVVPEWSTRNTVTLEGEVVFPGTYSIAPGETLRGVIERAGGLKATAFLGGAFFSRKSLREREKERLRRLQEETRRSVETQQRQLITNANVGDNAAAAGQLQTLLSSALDTVEDNPALGRLAINLDRVLAGDLNSRDDLVLQDGDRLLIPQRSNEVTVIGEVFAASSHVFEQGLGVSDYIEFAGGFRSTADAKAVYVVSASGRAKRATSGLFFGGNRGGNANIQPGDSIIVPLEIPKVRSPVLETLKEVTQILYNLSLGAAAINTFRN